MLKPIIPAILFATLISCVDALPQSRPCSEPVKSPFRYVIAHNDEIMSTSGETFRGIDVLMEPKSLSEANLKQLFAMLSSKFSRSNRLFVHVHTDLEDVYTPEEANQIAPTEMCNSLPGDKHPWAIYVRDASYEGFDYVQQVGGKVTTVQLRRRS